MTEEQKERRQPHRLCRLLRELRHASGLSLGRIEARTGFSAVVLGAYERGDRTPPLSKLEYVFSLYGYELQAVPMGSESTRLSSDIVADLRAIADQVEIRQAEGQFALPDALADEPELVDAHAV